MLASLWIVLRAVHFFAVLLLTGSAFYTALLAPRGYRPRLAQRLNTMMVGAAALSVISAVLMLSAQSGLMSGDWRNIGDITTWLAVLSTRWGHVWCAVIGAALLSMLAWRWHGVRRQRLLLLTGLIQLILMAGVGHAAMREGWLGWLQQSNHALHLIGVAFWGGRVVSGAPAHARSPADCFSRGRDPRHDALFSLRASGRGAGFADRHRQWRAYRGKSPALAALTVEPAAVDKSAAGGRHGGRCAGKSLSVSTALSLSWRSGGATVYSLYAV